MFDTMTMTKVVGAGCGSLLVFLLGAWAAESLYHTGGEQSVEQQAYAIDTGNADAASGGEEAGPSFEELYAAADPAKGEKVFAKCRACHKIDGSGSTGPHLDGVVDRPIAGVDGFGYSDVLAGMAGQSWTPENLDHFVTNPKGYAPGTKMTFAGLPKAADRANLIAYLASLQ